MISIYQINDAYKRISKYIKKTPIIYSDKLNNFTESNILIKAENLQKTGSFKIRGATNLISQIKEEKVVAPSSGNHAQAVAAASQLFNKTATLVMPSDAPKSKILGVKSYNGKIIFYDRNNEDRMEIANEISNREGSVLIPPYDHKEIIAGQGTLGVEIIEQLEEIKFKPDIILCCCGGGGLIAGVASAIISKWKNANVHPVEPKFWDDTKISLENNQRYKIKNKKYSICDALLAETPGKLTFNINKKLLSKGISVTDKEVMKAIQIGYEWLKMVIEPGGAVALAASINNIELVRNKNVLVILSGGNIDQEIFTKSLNINF